MSYLGLCHGHQLLAEALGGSVVPTATPEICVTDVQMTEMGSTGVLWMTCLIGSRVCVGMARKSQNSHKAPRF